MSYEMVAAINTQWDAVSLDDTFTAEWADPSLAGKFPVLSDGEAAEGTPMPYCVFEQEKPTRESTMSDGTSSVSVIWRNEFEFRIHARNKTVAVNMAKAIKEAFDNKSLQAGDSCVLQITNQGDFGNREGDEEWVWTIPYAALQNSNEATD